MRSEGNESKKSDIFFINYPGVNEAHKSYFLDLNDSVVFSFFTKHHQVSKIQTHTSKKCQKHLVVLKSEFR